jgi:hypothetical protein
MGLLSHPPQKKSWGKRLLCTHYLLPQKKSFTQRRKGAKLDANISFAEVSTGNSELGTRNSQ